MCQYLIVFNRLFDSFNMKIHLSYALGLLFGVSCYTFNPFLSFVKYICLFVFMVLPLIISSRNKLFASFSAIRSIWSYFAIYFLYSVIRVFQTGNFDSSALFFIFTFFWFCSFFFSSSAPHDSLSGFAQGLYISLFFLALFFSVTIIIFNVLVFFGVVNIHSFSLLQSSINTDYQYQISRTFFPYQVFSLIPLLFMQYPALTNKFEFYRPPSFLIVPFSVLLCLASAFSGTRAAYSSIGLFVLIISLPYLLKVFSRLRANLLSLFVSLMLFLSIIFFAIYFSGLISQMLDLGEYSNSIKLGYFQIYSQIFSSQDIFSFLMGQGLFEPFPHPLYNNVTITELSFLELFRRVGLIGVLFISLCLFSSILKIKIRTLNYSSRYFASISLFILFLPWVSTNPYLFSSTGFVFTFFLLYGLKYSNALTSSFKF